MLDARDFMRGAYDVATRLRHVDCISRKACAVRSGGTIRQALGHEVLASHVCTSRNSVRRDPARPASAGTIETGGRKIVTRVVAAL